MKLLSWFSLAVILALGTAGCGGRTAPANTLIYGRGGDANTLDPIHTDIGESVKVIVNVFDTLVTDAVLAHFAECPKLGSLIVKNTKVTEAGVKKLSAALPGCQIEWDGKKDK